MKSATLNSRLDFRLNRQVKDLICQAASLTGQSVSDFAVSVLSEQARRIVHDHSVTVLSNRDRDIFLAMLDANDKPNKALKTAAARFRKAHD